MRRRVCVAVLAVAAVAVTGGTAMAQDDTLVNTGTADPALPFSQNKQNEPAVAIDQAHPNILAAGANDNIDMELCNNLADNDCPFTDGVGVSGIYFSTDSGASWEQPTYQGYSARNCTGVAGTDKDECKPLDPGPIGTLPNYREAGLVSDGDPALAFGPAPDNRGRFRPGGTSRLYYANLTSKFPGRNPFKGTEAIAVSHTDDIGGAMAGDNDAWSDPVIASRQGGAQFSDKEQVWADNAASSPFYGNVYVCYAQFRGNGNGFTNQPLSVLTSTDGGDSWTQHQVTPATNNINSRNGFGRSGCTVRTDSRGTVYVFDYQFAFNANGPGEGKIQMIRSFDGGRHWQRPINVFTAFDTCNYVEPSIGRCVEDGVGGARSDLSPAPSVDIANGAPSGDGASDRMVISWVDGRDGLNHEHVMFSTSGRGGTSWTPLREIETADDRGYYSAPAISPDGSEVYVVYNAFTTLFGPTTTPHKLIGVVKKAAFADAVKGEFTPAHRGEEGDARSSSQNDLAAEFLGDYVYAAATNDYGTAVWNDSRRGADCTAIDQYRQALHEEAMASGQRTAEPEEPRGAEDRGHEQGEDDPATAPAPQQQCPPELDASGNVVKMFGNSDIFGISVTP